MSPFRNIRRLWHRGLAACAFCALLLLGEGLLCELVQPLREEACVRELVARYGEYPAVRRENLQSLSYRGKGLFARRYMDLIFADAHQAVYVAAEVNTLGLGETWVLPEGCEPGCEGGE